MGVGFFPEATSRVPAGPARLAQRARAYTCIVVGPYFDLQHLRDWCVVCHMAFKGGGRCHLVSRVLSDRRVITVLLGTFAVWRARARARAR